MATVLTLVATALSSCTSASSSLSPASAMPSLRSGCGVIVATTDPVAVPITVARTPAGPVTEVAVCVGGKGPYAFVADTGANRSVVTPALARALHLASAAGAASVSGSGCATTAPQSVVPGWSMGGLGLQGQTVLRAGVPTMGLSVAPQGLIGSDVLSRFFAVRLDYLGQKLTVLTGVQGSVPGVQSLRTGGSTTSAPALVHSGPTAAVGLTVLEGSGGTLVVAPVSLGASSESFVVGTGYPRSSVPSGTATGASLKGASGTSAAAGVGCSGSQRMVASGPWAIGSRTLEPQALALGPLPGALRTGLQGVVGSDVLGGYGSVVLDYRSASLQLGAG